jgi:hypothetical protein
MSTPGLTYRSTFNNGNVFLCGQEWYDVVEQSKDTGPWRLNTSLSIFDVIASATSKTIFKDLQSVNTDSATASRAAHR